MPLFEVSTIATVEAENATEAVRKVRYRKGGLTWTVEEVIEEPPTPERSWWKPVKRLYHQFID